MNRVCVFAGYSRDSLIHPYVIYFLEKLREVATKIIYVSDCEIKNKDVLDNIVDATICERHEEYDFGSYKRGFKYAEKEEWLKDAD